MAAPDGRVVSRPQRLGQGSGRGPKGRGACLHPLDSLEQKETQEQTPGQLDMLRKAQEFFQTCDAEGKGFIARKDMQRLHKELPLSLEELEDVFDALDADGNGYLTPEEFTAGFSHFFFRQNNPSQEDAGEQVAQRHKEKVYQSRGNEDLGDTGEDEEAQFQMLMDRLGAQKVLEDESDVKQLWLQLKKDEPHLLSNFEDFLTRIFSQLQEAHEEKNELEYALKRKIAAYDEEIQHLYEEMEQQIKSEKEQFLLKGSVPRDGESTAREGRAPQAAGFPKKNKAAKANTAASRASWKKRSGSVIGKYVDGRGILRSQSEEEEEVFSIPRRSSLGLSGYPLTEEEPGTGEPGPGGPYPRPLRRIISIEEDPLPQLLDGGFEQPLSKCPEEEEVSDQGAQGQIQEAPPLKLTPTSPRGQPVGKEAVCKEESSPSAPDRLFKIVFVGNSAVGKTSFLRRFCEDRFSPGMAATVGIDYRVKTVNVDDSQVALQLWDTAGQERYRCITQQFFRKADGVIVMYDLTDKQSFLSVRRWLSSVEEAVGDRVPVLLLGNKLDNEKEREVPRGLGEQLAKDNNLIFYECSAYSGHNTKESLLHLARFLKEQEDTVREDTIQVGHPAKKKSCCG
nr:EF-hand calcium-binding domain-containing protein 4B isoform X3 [Macaca nemestrina]